MKTSGTSQHASVPWLTWELDHSDPFQAQEYRPSRCSLRDTDFVLDVLSQPVHLDFPNHRTYELQIFVDSFSPSQTVEFCAHDTLDAQKVATLYALDWLNERVRGWDSPKHRDHKSLGVVERLTPFAEAPEPEPEPEWHLGCEDTAP